jgi:predicted nuclease of predicted toxin-antitoxin system
VHVKLLLDENISPVVATTLCAEGIDACHVRDRRLLGATDPQVLELAFAEDRILVTSNVDDFVKLAHARDVHPGIVLLERGGMLRDEQIDVVRRAVAAIATHGAMVNMALRVADDGTMTFEEIPPP